MGESLTEQCRVEVEGLRVMNFFSRRRSNDAGLSGRPTRRAISSVVERAPDNCVVVPGLYPTSELNSFWLKNLFLVALEQLGDFLEEIRGFASGGNMLGGGGPAYGSNQYVLRRNIGISSIS
ncbi:hypothetical protein Ahy_A06g028235 [Arachis hypogaea]|uniref:Protein Ycf2 n=1 Tax=Arachis hypogaea TaxID=3818 RepID=A0A445CQK9_ARAHY|nr:hypothetical protein Ahy_A06g028235 [Arachis hypogaea]